MLVYLKPSVTTVTTISSKTVSRSSRGPGATKGIVSLRITRQLGRSERTSPAFHIIPNVGTISHSAILPPALFLQLSWMLKRSWAFGWIGCIYTACCRGAASRRPNMQVWHRKSFEFVPHSCATATSDYFWLSIFSGQSAKITLICSCMISEPCLKSHGHQQAAAGSCCASTNDHARDPILCSDSICYQRCCAISRPENTSGTHHLPDWSIAIPHWGYGLFWSNHWHRHTHIFLLTIMPPPSRCKISHFSFLIVRNLVACRSTQLSLL